MAGTPNASEGQPSLPTETRKNKPKQGLEKSENNSEADNESQASSQDSEAGSDADSYAEPDLDLERGETPKPVSWPCTCRCGGCCCHTSSFEPQHCVRCHRDYTFNHSQACSVPHVYSADQADSEEYPRDYEVRSICCGGDVTGTETAKSGWRQPFPCFIGWHTADVNAVDDQYNGLNVLRCNPGPGGKCQRTGMRHHAHYEHLYDDKVKYIDADSEDRETYLKRKRTEIGDDAFEDQFGFVEDHW